MTAHEPNEIATPKPSAGLARKGAWAIADQGVLSAGNFLTGWILARLAAPEEYGAWAMIYVAILAFNSLQSALISVPMMVIGATHEGSQFRRYATAMGLAQALVIALLAFTSLCAGPLVALFSKTDLLAPWSAMSLALIFLHCQEFCRRVLYAKLQMPRVFALDLLTTTLQLGGLWTLWRLTGGQWGVPSAPGALSATNAFLVAAAATLAGTVFGWLQIRHHFEFVRESLRDYWRQSWQLGRPGLGGLLGETLHFQGALTVISLTLGPLGTALAEIPRAMMAPLNILHFAGVNVIMPRAAQYLKQHGRHALAGYLPRLAALWLIPFVLYPMLIAAAPVFWLHLLYGGKWDHAAHLLELAAVGQGLIGVRAFPWMIVTAMMRNDLYMRCSLGTGLLAVVATALLVPSQGAGAVLIARIVADTVALVAGVIVLWRLLRTPEATTPAAVELPEGA